MSLEMTEPGCFMLEGPVTFDNAATVAVNGEAALARFLASNAEKHWEINLSAMQLADSSALSVFLSWMRFAHSKNVSICFSNIPAQLEALAKVSDVYDLVKAVSCDLKHNQI